MRLRSLSRSLFALATVIGSSVMATQLHASESFIVGPRALGMGGTGVASTNDEHAQYYNPGAFGFFSSGDKPEDGASHRPVDNQNLYNKDWGFGVDASVGFRVHDRFAEYADTLKNVYDSNLVQRIEAGSYALTSNDVLQLSNFATALQGVDAPNEYITADLNAGFGLRIKHFGIGVRAYGEVIGVVSHVDLSNLGSGSGNNAATNISNALNSASTSGPGGALTPDQITQLNPILGAGSVHKLDQLAAQQGLNSAQLQPLVELLSTANASTGSITSNTTTISLRGTSFAEIPVSYGYAINDNVSFGGSVKYMKGRLYGTTVRVFDDSAKDSLNEAKNNYHDSSNFSVDLGVMARMSMFQAGIVGRNLTKPRFQGFTTTTTLSNGATVSEVIDDYTVDPSAAAGVAFIPAPWFTLAADLDLTRNKTINPDYKTQRLGVGAEANLWYVLALRGGVMKNLAESEPGIMYTAGLGLNLWALRIDAAGAFSPDKTTFDGKDVPREMRGSVQVAVDF